MVYTSEDATALLPFIVTFAMAGVLFGIVLIVRAFRSLKLRRLTENMPTAAARSMALGPVELKGVIGPGLAVSDPVYRMPCVYFWVRVEHRAVTSREGSLSWEWITESETTSGRRPFWLADETARALIWAQQADMRLGREVVFHYGFLASIFGSSPPLEYVRRMRQRRVFFRRVRVSIHVVRPGHPVYALGYAVRSEEVGPTAGPYEQALREAAAGERNRVIVRGPGEFIIVESEGSAAPGRPAMFARVVVGIGIITASSAALGLCWMMLRA